MNQGILMPEEKWGVKRLCPKCATRFYDLQNDPMTCPACDEEITLASLMDTGNRSAGKAKPKPEPKAPAEEAEVILEDDDDSEKATDDDLLDDDDEDTVNLEEIKDVAAEDDDS